jgi:N utilization substance protein B
MTSPRRRARETALKALYQADISKTQCIDALYEVLGQTVYAPTMEAVAKDFLKASTLKEVKAGRVEDFVFNFTDSFSLVDKNSRSDEELKDSAKEILETHFSKITVKRDAIEELERFYKRTLSRYKRISPIREFSMELVNCVADNKTQLDGIISETSENWTLDRIALVDLCILRLSVAELFYFDSIPVNVTINEAIEMAKKYSDGRSYEFVNGILNRIGKDSRIKKIEKDKNKDEAARA